MGLLGWDDLDQATKQRLAASDPYAAAMLQSEGGKARHEEAAERLKRLRTEAGIRRYTRILAEEEEQNTRPTKKNGAKSEDGSGGGMPMVACVLFATFALHILGII